LFCWTKSFTNSGCKKKIQGVHNETRRFYHFGEIMEKGPDYGQLLVTKYVHFNFKKSIHFCVSTVGASRRCRMKKPQYLGRHLNFCSVQETLHTLKSNLSLFKISVKSGPFIVCTLYHIITAFIVDTLYFLQYGYMSDSGIIRNGRGAYTHAWGIQASRPMKIVTYD
jgi:hypothetical protein